MKKPNILSFKKIFWVFFILLFISAVDADVLLKEIYLAARINNESIAFTGPVEATVGDTVYIYPVIKTEVGGREFYFSDAESCKVYNRNIPPGKLKKWDSEQYGRIKFFWYEITPERFSYGNDLLNDVIEQITYRESLTFSSNRWKQTLTGKPGTFRCKVEARLGSQIISSPGGKNVNREGLLPKILRISVRENKREGDNVDYMTLFFNLPYIWGNSRNQVEKLVGADCQDLVWFGLKKARLVPRAEYDRHIHDMYRDCKRFDGYIIDGETVDKDSNKVNVQVKRGDIVRLAEFGHYGAIYEDCAPQSIISRLLNRDGQSNGKLDGSDLVLHILFDKPKIERLDKLISKYNDNHIQIFRF